MDRIRRAVGSDFEIEFHPHGLPEEELRLALADAEVVIGEPAPHLLHETRSVKWVQMTWAGTDLYTRGSLSFPEGMRLTNASGGFGNIISQYVVGQTLSLMQNLPHYRLQQQEDKWADLGPVASLEGATVMIFGAGNIGSEIARRLQGFDCTIMGICRSPKRTAPILTLCSPSLRPNGCFLWPMWSLAASPTRRKPAISSTKSA